MASNREIRIAADSVLALHRTLKQEVGGQAATVALQKAGHAAGDALFQELTPDALGQTPHSDFWARLSDLFDQQGWGTVSHQDLHAGVGGLMAHDWFEIDPAAATPTCPFSTGVLSNVLGRVAGQDVAVMVVPCDNDDDGCCRFLFGSGPVLQKVYAGLQDGGELQTALTALG